jgi:hypothetical protein
MAWSKRGRIISTKHKAPVWCPIRKETHVKGTKSKLTVVDERAWDPGRPLTIDEAHNYYK